jgi:GGDEF domain-containing protein
MPKHSGQSIVKPLIIDAKFNALGLFGVLSAIVAIVIKWKDFHDFFFPKDVILTWQFFILVILLATITTWFIMNHFWRKEFEAHDITRKDRDNFMDQLKISENERLTDVITGIPNARSLEKDIKSYFSSRNNKQMQFILIDLKDFRKINKQFGFNKTNNLLRLISQSIYKKMRRNEDMYKYFAGEKKKSVDNDGFYRIYPGGDEFAFIIEGDQSDAIGFSNRLSDQFNALSIRTKEVLGEEVKLSFHCAIVEMDARDTFEDILIKAKDCYQISKEGSADFTMCWHPINVETILSRAENKRYSYIRAREIFEVLTLTEVNSA